ncbi:MAG: hypothetical protein H8D48_04870 [Actinobacteria bacterium]|nr:hypothetical protein [Actinomycetota bacterium]
MGFAEFNDTSVVIADTTGGRGGGGCTLACDGFGTGLGGGVVGIGLERFGVAAPSPDG